MTSDFDALFKTNFNYSVQIFLFIGIFIAIAVKTPVYFLNIWLLKAHVESPLSGSIILAAIVLKLSLYGAMWSRISLTCLELSNSGNPLKLLVPSYSWKTISGWSNDSCKVTTQKMIEKEMGYRGSKLVGLRPRKGSTTVKEQRVDGSWHNNGVMCLRCILMDFERNYQIKILSNQINKQTRLFSWVPTKAIQQDSGGCASYPEFNNVPLICYRFYRRWGLF